jgi:hypothetical protein
MKSAILIWLIFLTALCPAQSDLREPVSCGDVNNTSASPRFHNESNGDARPRNVSKLPFRSLLYPGSTTRLYTRFMPWFGDSKHKDVGYHSDDPEQIARQVSDMLSRGLQGAIVDWYGPDSGVKNQSTILLMKEAERQSGFEFAISEDAGSVRECAKRGCNPTDKLISDLTYAAEHFESSPAYLRFDGRPAVFFFGLETSPIDWRRVRQSLPLNPLLFFRNSGTFTNPDADGAYAWIAPETESSADPMALQYLERFYSKGQHSNKIAMGSAYKGFNDSEASWGKGRVIDQQCGRTWLATFAEAGRFYSSSHQLPALIIPTWNDYEEGTEIETGIDNCVQVKAGISGDKLDWNISGSEDTIARYLILAQQGSEWNQVAEVPAGSHSVRLQDLSLAAGTASLCVEALGKASLLNHFSAPVQYSTPAGKTSPR